MASQNITEYDIGPFGTKILMEYCGSDIAYQFYDESHPMLLTERQMAFISTQFTIEYMVSAMIVIIFQVILRMYCRSISNCCCKRNKHSENDADSANPNSSISLRITDWNNKTITDWSNEDIVLWLRTIDILKDEKSKLIFEINKIQCNGADIASLQNSDAFAQKFHSISNNKQLCDTLSTELNNIKSKTETEVKSTSTQPNDDTSRITLCLRILMRITIVWCCILGLIMMVHYFHQLANYYYFVRKTVKFESFHTNATMEECEEYGIGRIQCPDLLNKYSIPEEDIIVEAYTQQNAQNICFWVYNVLVIANPTLFKYAWFASFTLFDFILYHMTMFILGCFTTICCNCWAFLGCCYGCCCQQCTSPCCPVPRCCCMLNWGEKFCADGCCCYFCCGCLGVFSFVMWLLQLILISVIMTFVLTFWGLPLLVIALVQAILMLIIVCLCTLPTCVCNPKMYCNLLLVTHAGRGEVVDLKVNEVIQSDDSENEEYECIWLWSLFCFRVCLPLPITYPEKNYKEKVRSLLDSGEMDILITQKIYSHGSMIIGPIVMMLSIACVESLISTFIVYFVVDGSLYFPWFYFEPFYHGMVDAISEFVELVSDHDLDNFKYILMESVSFKSFIDFSLEQPDGFRYAVLFHRTLLHIIIGILYIAATDY